MIDSDEWQPIETMPPDLMAVEMKFASRFGSPYRPGQDSIYHATHWRPMREQKKETTP